MNDQMLRYMCVERVLAVYNREHVTVRDFSAVIAEAKELYAWVTGEEGETLRLFSGDHDESIRRFVSGSSQGVKAQSNE